MIVERCDWCDQPAHASETDDRGACAACASMIGLVLAHLQEHPKRRSRYDIIAHADGVHRGRISGFLMRMHDRGLIRVQARGMFKLPEVRS